MSIEDDIPAGFENYPRDNDVYGSAGPSHTEQYLRNIEAKLTNEDKKNKIEYMLSLSEYVGSKGASELAEKFYQRGIELFKRYFPNEYAQWEKIADEEEIKNPPCHIFQIGLYRMPFRRVEDILDLHDPNNISVVNLESER